MRARVCSCLHPWVRVFVGTPAFACVFACVSRTSPSCSQGAHLVLLLPRIPPPRHTGPSARVSRSRTSYDLVSRLERLQYVHPRTCACVRAHMLAVARVSYSPRSASDTSSRGARVLLPLIPLPRHTSSSARASRSCTVLHPLAPRLEMIRCVCVCARARVLRRRIFLPVRVCVRVCGVCALALNPVALRVACSPAAPASSVQVLRHGARRHLAPASACAAVSAGGYHTREARTRQLQPRPPPHTVLFCHVCVCGGVTWVTRVL